MDNAWSNETITMKLKSLCGSVGKMRKYVYGTAAIAGLFVFLVSIGAFEVRSIRASVGDVREKHTKEYRDMELSIRKEIKTLERGMNEAFYEIGKDLGRNEASHIRIAERLSSIEQKLDRIAEWQREQK